MTGAPLVCFILGCDLFLETVWPIKEPANLLNNLQSDLRLRLARRIQYSRSPNEILKSISRRFYWRWRTASNNLNKHFSVFFLYQRKNANEENKKKNLEHQKLAASFFAAFFSCTVIRLLLLTGISSMLLIAEILLSLIHGLKAFTLRRRRGTSEEKWKQIKFSHSFYGIKCNVIDLRQPNPR